MKGNKRRDMKGLWKDALLCLFVFLAAILLLPGEAPAPCVDTITACYECHPLPPVDGTREWATGATPGSHQAHDTAGAQCYDCHVNPGANLNHRNSAVNMNATSVTYSKGSSFAQSSNPVLGTCNNTTCHDDGLGNMLTTPTWGTSVTACTACHVAMPTSGSHSGHLGYSAISCGNCHDGAVQGSSVPVQHTDGDIDVYATADGDLGYPANKTKNTAYTICDNMYCHGSASPTWGNNTTRDACTKCHGDTAAGSSATDAQIAPPRDTAGHTASTDAEVGAHQVHLGSSSSTAAIVNYNIACSECHTKPANVFDAGHLDSPVAWDGQADVSFGSMATQGTYGTETYGGTTCNNVYCHDERQFSSSMHSAQGNYGGTDPDPAWNDTAYQSGSSPRTSADCAKCHFWDSSSQNCSQCHDHVNSTNNGFDTGGGGLGDHINGTPNASGGHAFPYYDHATAAGASPFSACTGCHTNGTNTTYPVTAGTAPDCQGCHKKGTVGTSPVGNNNRTACSSCHGAALDDGTANAGRPSQNTSNTWNATLYPDNSMGHASSNVAEHPDTCAKCHGTGVGGGQTPIDTSHGPDNRTASSRTTDINIVAAIPWNQTLNHCNGFDPGALPCTQTSDPHDATWLWGDAQ